MDQQFSRSEVLTTADALAAEYLGTGGYGETWRVEVSPGKSVARKLLYKDGYDTARLAREVEGLQRVDSPYVVKLLGVDDATIRDRRVPYLDFEYIPGGDLQKWVEAHSKVPADDADHLASGLLQGVAALHDAKILHRDIKPANVALRNGNPRAPVLLDLGLAKLLDLDSITRYPSHVGTAMYMAPEQFRGERAVKGSDVWAVGVLLHQVVSGHHPFYRDGEQLTFDDVLRRLSNPPQPPTDASLALRQLIARCLQQEPYQRGNAARAHVRFIRETQP